MRGSWIRRDLRSNERSPFDSGATARAILWLPRACLISPTWRTRGGNIIARDSLIRKALEILRGRSWRAASVPGTDPLGRIAGHRAQPGQLSSGGHRRARGHRHAEGPGHGPQPSDVPILNDYALSRSDRGRSHGGDRADASGRIARLRRSSVPPIQYLAAHLENLGLVYDAARIPDSNVAVLKQALAMRRAVLADDNPAIGRTLFNLAVSEYAEGDYAAAEPLYEESLARMRQRLRTGTHRRGLCHRQPGPQPVSSRPAHRRRAESAVGPWSEGSGRRCSARPLYSRFAPLVVSLLLDQRRWAEAEPIALRLLAIRDSMADTLARQTAGQLVTLYEGWGKPDRAAEYRSGQRRRARPMCLRIRA